MLLFEFDNQRVSLIHTVLIGCRMVGYVFQELVRLAYMIAAQFGNCKLEMMQAFNEALK